MDLDRTRIDKYWQERTKIQDAQISARHRADEAPKFDLEFIRPYLTQNCKVLDLGAGSCIIADQLSKLSEVHSVRAVEKFGDFFKKRLPSPKVVTQVSDILAYSDSEKYDVILLFGVLNYFSTEEAATLYLKCSQYLKSSGVLLIKHQCGLVNDVEVDHFSAELGHDYQAIYRSVDHETVLLEKYFRVDKVVDVYPPELNRWNNTHFFGFVCRPTLL